MHRLVHRLGWLALLLSAHAGALHAQPLPIPPSGDFDIRALIDAQSYSEAETILRARLAAHESARTTDTADAANDTEWLALLLSMTDRAGEAEPLARAAVATRERLRDDRATGRSLNRLASILLERRELDEAETTARRAIALLAASGPSDDRLVAAWGNLGRILYARGHLPEAIAGFDSGIAVGRQMKGADESLVPTLQSLRAAVEADMDRSRTRAAEQRRKAETAAATSGPDSTAAAAELYLLSLHLARQGETAEAATIAEDAWAIQTLALGAEHADTRASLYQLATLLRREAAARNRGDIGPAADPILPSESEEDIRRLIDRGLFVRAEAAVRARLAQHGTAAGSPDAATDMELLANILYRTGRTREAEALMTDVVDRRERLGEPHALSAARRRLALILSARGRYTAAEAQARRAIALVAPLGGDVRSLSAAWGTLGEILAGQRRRPEASAALQKSIDHARTALGDEDDFVLEEYNGFALNREEMGDIGGAEAIYRRNLGILARTHGRGSLETARTLALLAGNLERQDRALEAEVRLRQAIAIRERHLGPGNPDTLRSSGNLVGLLTRDGRYDEAAALQARIAALRSAQPEHNAEEAIADLGRMGTILAKQGRLDAAIDYQRRALARANEALDPRHPYVGIASMALATSLAQRNPASREYVDLMRGAAAGARSERARLLSARDVDGADAGERAVAAAIGDDSWSDAAGSTVFARALTLFASRATAVPAEEAALRSESFRIAQDAVSEASTRALAGIVAREALGDTPLARLIRRRQDLASEIRDLNRTLGAAMIGAPDAGAGQKARIAALGRELAGVEARLRRSYPDFARLAVPATLSEKQVQRRLRPGEALLLVVQADHYDFTYVVTPDTAGWHAVPRLQSFLKGTIEAFRCEVDPQTCSGIWTASPLFDRRYAWDLYRFLVQPHEPLLKDVKTLYVTTSGALSDLPFAAFITAPPEGEDSEAALAATPWLGDRFAIVNLPSVESLRIERQRPAGRDRMPFVGYGAPILARADGTKPKTSGLSPQPGGDGLADIERLRALPSLPGTEIELNAMADVLGAGAGAVHLGAAATEAAIRSNGQLPRARIVAFATHGVLPGEIEGFAEPGLIFTPPGRATRDDDGILTAAEAADLDLSAEWVILSACNTATTEGAGGGDALSALARSFLHAGAGALLASRWRIGDQVTAALTVETLASAERNPGAGKAAALQSAMRAIRTGRRDDGTPIAGWNRQWVHPAAWAPFTLIATEN